MFGGRVVMTTPMLFANGFIFLFTLGGEKRKHLHDDGRIDYRNGDGKGKGKG